MSPRPPPLRSRPPPDVTVTTAACPLLQPERPRMPSSPMELLRYLNSPEYKQAQEEQWARVRNSYEVGGGEV